jgi:hypothetical protein
MKQIFYVFWQQYSWEAEGIFIFWHAKITDSEDCFFIREIELDIPEIELPSREQVARLKVTALESERQAILAETHRKVQVIDDKIRQLSAIEFKGESA